MGSLSPAGTRRLLRVLALCAVAIGALVTLAAAAGPGGWDHLGDRGTPGTDSLDLVASALAATPGALYVGGEFTDAGGIPDADRIATWNGSTWSAVSSSTSQISNGRVSAIAVSGGKVYAGGTFQNAGGDANADFLAVWDGASWEPFCDAAGPAFNGNVTQPADHRPDALRRRRVPERRGHRVRRLPARLRPGHRRRELDGHRSGRTPSPARCTRWRPTATARSTRAEGSPTWRTSPPPTTSPTCPPGGTWQPMGAGAGPCGCAVTTFVRGLTAVGTDVVRRHGRERHRRHPAGRPRRALERLGVERPGRRQRRRERVVPDDHLDQRADRRPARHLFATGTFQNANGDTRADNVAFFDGTAWHPVGSDGAGNGPWTGTGLALALVDRQLYAAGSFTSAGGDAQAHSVASFALSQIIAYPTPTVTPDPAPVPTPTVTAGPNPVPTPTVTRARLRPDVTPPATSLRKAQIKQAKRTATFRFASGEPGSTFTCKLDAKRFRPCTSPKTYRKLKRGKHVFRVKARDRAGNVDATPAVKRFKIKRR